MLPPTIAILQNLRTLILNGNQLTALPSDLGKLKNLEKLEVGNNQVAAVPKELGRLGRLEELSLTGNPIDYIPPHLGGCSSLEVLDLSNCLIAGLPEEFTLCTRLMELNLGNNRLRELPEGMGRMTRLVVLNLMDNQLADLPLSLGFCVGLGKLGAGISIARNPIKSEDMLAKYAIGVDHLLDFLEKRIALQGTPHLPDLTLPEDLWPAGHDPNAKVAGTSSNNLYVRAFTPPASRASVGPSPVVSPAPSPVADRKPTPAVSPSPLSRGPSASGLAPDMQNLSVDEQLLVKVTMLKNWALSTIRGELVPKLKKFKGDVCRATAPQDAMPLAQTARNMKAESDRGRAMLPPSRIPLPPAPVPMHQLTPSGNEKLDALKLLVANTTEEVLLTVDAISNLLPSVNDYSAVLQMVTFIKNLKASLG
eukprot:TRINITY_DN684_c0_g1_i2.p1 TRINITY_DN684_c0_g1~~TRINITY_DN684_c0_g1_i2.p1  ORF type:complete len:491 (-),score=96.29 TRINITY_DN684_c0_g1_i2:1007-2272(-)